MANRPLGITILAILQLLSAVVAILGGATAVSIALLLGPAGFIVLILGAIVLVIGIIGLIVFYGLWNLKGWAWWLTFILNLITIIMAFPNFFTINVAISVIIVIYLWLPDVKSKFR